MDPITKHDDRATVAIIGGGPGGLFTAYLLQHVYRVPVDVTILEASDRLGGKIITRKIGPTNAIYEAGAAELYDYSALGPDPLRELIDQFGLRTFPMGGRTVFLGDTLLAGEADVGRVFGSATAAAVAAFCRGAKAAIAPSQYYESDWQTDNADPLAGRSFDALLAEIGDDAARHYIEAAVHSDVAVEPRHTSASYGLQNYLMNEPGYMQFYGIEGGLEQLPRAVAATLSAEVRLNARVRRVTALDEDRYAIELTDGTSVGNGFDFCVVALPNYWLTAIEWAGPALARAMAALHAHYDHPAHYLRVSIWFRRPFWRDVVRGEYFMLDAFGGCCVYDESVRGPRQTDAPGCLGWLIAGDAALRLANLDDRALIARVLEALPAPLRHGRDLVTDARVHRWVGAVNGLPGGFPLQDPDARHCPDPAGHPGLFVVGDYLFDSTLNGVLDSADYVAAWIGEELAPEAGDAVEPQSLVTPA